MCGISGIYGLDESRRRDLLQVMTDKIAHRGPENQGLFLDGKIGLAHQRLMIIDPDRRANQPMTSQSGKSVLIFNGEVYNFRELRAKLPRRKWRTDNDAEVVLELFEAKGPSCLSELNGMFAFAFWNKEKEELFLVRDRLGIKPLYYQRNQNQELFFASEIRSLLSTDRIEKKIDENSLQDYLRYQTVHAPSTIIKGVNMLMPGSYLQVKNGSFEEEKYWDLQNQAQSKSSEQTALEIKKSIRQKLFESVERRLIADVPFGAFLSGGIDSSAVVAIMSKIQSEAVRTFSVTFNEEEFSEEKYAAIIAKKYNTVHTNIKLTPDDFLELIPEALAAMDHPSGDGPNTYVVSKHTRNRGITMALSGLGGDELFAGYPVFKQLHRLEGNKWLKWMPKLARQLGGEGIKALKPGMASSKLSEVLQLENPGLLEAYPISRQVLLDLQVFALLKTDMKAPNSVLRIAQSLKNQSLPILSKISYLEISTYMQNVLLRDTDQMSMAHALEVRVPFLDHDLVEYVLGIRDDIKFPHSQKKLLVESVSDLVPEEIVNRPKMGFILPWERWMKQELKDLVEQNLDYLKSLDYFVSEELDGLYKEFVNGKLSWSRIWPLVVLGHWTKQHHVN